MARFRTSRMKVLLGLAVVAVLAAAFGVAQLAFAAGGQNNNGTVKIHEGAGEPSPVTKDETHVCTFHVHALFFDAGQTVTFEIKSWQPTGDRSVVLSGTIKTDASGEGRSPEEGAYTLDEGHYRLIVDTGNGTPTEDKHKEFWVKCAAATTTTAGETTTTAGETTTSGASSSTLGETSTTAGETTTTAGETTTSGASSSTLGETSTTAGETTTTAGETSTSGETSTTEQPTTTTQKETTTSEASSTLGETSTTAGETTTTQKETTTSEASSTSGETSTTAGETTSSSASSSSVGGASSSAPSSSVGLGAVAARRPLPRTGTNALPVLVAGLVLFGIGAAAVRAARRR
jgi:hypothetical protein